MIEITDYQWCILDILRNGILRGYASVDSDALLNHKMWSEGVRLKLVWGAKTMPEGLISWSGNVMTLTDAGLQAFVDKFGTDKRTWELN